MKRKTQATAATNMVPLLRRLAPARLVRGAGLILHWLQWMLLDVRANHLRLHTAGLVYTTLLTLVPMMAVVFALLKTFDAHLWVEPFLLQYLAPLGAGKSLQITEQLMAFITQTRVGVLGTVSMGILLLAVLKLAQQLEAACNSIWFVTRPRRWWQRSRDALTLLMLGPVLLAAALGATAAARQWGILQSVFNLPLVQGAAVQVFALVPTLLTLGLVWLLYLWGPYTKIGKGPALVGAITALALWKCMGVVFKLFIAGSGQYEAVYSGFAAAILLVMWIYFSWLIFLLGAQVSYWVQHRRYLSGQIHGVLTPATRLRLSLEACALIARAHHRGDKAPSVDDLSRRLRLPPPETQALLLPLFDAGLLARDDAGGLTPKQATHKVTLQKLVAALQGKPAAAGTPGMTRLISQLLQAQQKAAGEITWADLAL